MSRVRDAGKPSILGRIDIRLIGTVAEVGSRRGRRERGVHFRTWSSCAG